MKKARTAVMEEYKEARVIRAAKKEAKKVQQEKMAADAKVWLAKTSVYTLIY